MSRRRILAGFAMLAVLGAVVLLVAVLGGDEGLDENEYMARNLLLLAELPVFPGARPLSTISDRFREPGTSVVCNTTSRIFALPGETSRARVISYYDTHMRGFRLGEGSPSRLARSFRNGPAFVHLLVHTPSEYVLSVDHRCRGP